MKRLIRADREIFPGEYNYWYGNRPSSPTSTEILGTTIGGLEVFQVYIDGKDLSYFWGNAPKNKNINIFGEFAFNLEKDLGIKITHNDSDSQIVAKVESIARSAVEDTRSQALFDYLNIDPLSIQWKVALGRYIWIENLCELSIKDPTHFVPTSYVITQMLESGDSIDPNIDLSPNLEEAKEYLRSKKANERLASQEYPYGATDDVVEAIHELQNLIVKKNLGGASTLEEAEDFVISKSIEYKRSPKYQDPKVENDIRVLFDWAFENNLSVDNLISAARKIYKIYMAR